jgi:hypothetical protein
MVVMVLLGGKGTLWGPVIGAVIFHALKEVTWTYLLGWQFVALGVLNRRDHRLFPAGVLAEGPHHQRPNEVRSGDCHPRFARPPRSSGWRRRWAKARKRWRRCTAIWLRPSARRPLLRTDRDCASPDEIALVGVRSGIKPRYNRPCQPCSPALITRDARAMLKMPRGMEKATLNLGMCSPAQTSSWR